MTMNTKTNFWTDGYDSHEMKKVLDGLYVARTESNQILQARLHGVSNEAQRVIRLISNETTEEQERLLTYARIMQAKFQKMHEEWLEKYIIQLDQWQARELAKLQEKLVVSKEKINDVFQKKLALVNRQVDEEKSRIFHEEADKQTRATEEIVSEIVQSPGAMKTSHIATGAETNIHLKIRANAGNEERVDLNPTYDEPRYDFLN